MEIWIKFIKFKMKKLVMAAIFSVMAVNSFADCHGSEFRIKIQNNSDHTIDVTGIGERNNYDWCSKDLSYHNYIGPGEQKIIVSQSARMMGIDGFFKDDFLKYTYFQNFLIDNKEARIENTLVKPWYIHLGKTITSKLSFEGNSIWSDNCGNDDVYLSIIYNDRDEITLEKAYCD